MRNFLQIMAAAFVLALLAGDTTAFAQAPEIVATSPDQNELNVPVNTNISVTFDTDMDEATINNSTFVVHARSTGLHQGTITYDSPSRTATLDPFEDFDVGEVVTVVLTTGIESSGGTPLDNSYVWSFTVAADDGTGIFGTGSAYAVGDHPMSVYAADFDDDGDIDLATANFNSHDVSVLLNNGDGSFAPHSDYAVFYVPYAVFAADLDGDGDVDIITGSETWVGDSISVLLNNGDGTFGAYLVYAVNGQPLSVFAADLDGDGDLDIATASRDSSNVSVLLNNGDGSFAPYSSYEVGNGPRRLFAADVDGDGAFDVVTANIDSDSVSVLLNNGNGTFAPHSMYEVAAGPGSIFAADLNGDGYLDLTTGNAGSDDASVLLNNGDGTFGSRSDHPVGGDMPASVFIADLDGDGDLDLATANWYSHDVSVLHNNGDGTFAPYSLYPVVGYYPISTFAADLDGDGDLDLAVATESDSVTILLNQEFTCGDVDGNGLVAAGDLAYLQNYLWNDGPSPPVYEQADMDDYKVITSSDYFYLADWLFFGGPMGDCDLDHGKLSGPVDSNNYLELVEIAFPANETSMTLHFNLSTSVSLYIGDLPIRIRVDGQVPTMTNCQLTSLLNPFDMRLCKINEDSGKVLFSFGTVGSVGPLSGEMASVDIGMPASGSARLITVEWDPFPPVHHDPPEYNNEYSHYPLLVEPDKTAWTPALIVHPCCTGIRGNVNGDPGDQINVADLTYLVSYLFKGGPAPPCFEEGDVNGDGKINVSDLTYVVSYLFKGGPAPADCPPK